MCACRDEHKTLSHHFLHPCLSTFSFSASEGISALLTTSGVMFRGEQALLLLPQLLFPCGTLHLFKPEVPEMQTQARRLLKHIQISKDMLYLIEGLRVCSNQASLS